MTKPLAAVVLAAGQGKRMRSPGPKVLVPCAGRPLVEHVLEALRPVGPAATVVVFGHGGDAVRRALDGRGLLFAHQPEQRGTGHAVQCALPALRDFRGDILVLCGDTPLLTAEALLGLLEDHRSAGRALTVLSAELENPGQLGRILRGADGKLRSIREWKDGTEAERAIREINTGVIVADSARLPAALARLTPENAQGEYYLTDVPALLLAEGLPVDAFRTSDAGAALGVNNPVELAEAARLVRRRVAERLLAAGVLLDDPERTVLDAGIEVGAGTRIHPFTWIGAGARIGAGCRIGPHATIGAGATVGDGATVLEYSSVGDGAAVPAGSAFGRARGN
jgi:bifunctional UDP-N-acetylglucosamine pyrophosphorylase/glucosamine-1-phosphate N-acetyltransferase